MKRKDLEIMLSMHVSDFQNPKVELEQYMTPARVASNLLHRAYILGDIEGKNVVDLGAGTGMLSLGASFLGGKVTAVEMDMDAVTNLRENTLKVEANVQIINKDIFELSVDTKYDTAILNPPFGIQQKKNKDMDFIKKAHSIANIVYSIHDGNKTNQQELSKIFGRFNFVIDEMHLDEFQLKQKFGFHKKTNYSLNVLIIRSLNPS